MFRKIFTLILATLIFISLPILVLILSPIFIFRYIVAKNAKYIRPSLGKMLTTKSQCVGVDDISENPQWTLLLAVVVKGNHNLEKLQLLFQDRVIESKNEEDQLKKPELMQYPSNFMGFKFWKWDDDFKVENHIHAYDGEIKLEKRNEEGIFKIAQTLIYKPYVPRRSPWEIICLENCYCVVDGRNETCTVLLLRAHHVLVDGFSLLKMFILDVCQAKELNVAQPSSLPGQKKPGGSKKQRLFGPLYLLFRAPYDFATAIIDVTLYNSNEWHVPEKQLTRNLNCAMISTIPTQTVKDLKNKYNTSFAAILLTAYTAAIRKFMMEAGYKIPKRVLCAISLPMPSHPDKLRNHATGVLVRLPTGFEDPVERLNAVHENQTRLKSSTLPIMIFYSMTVIGGLFSWMTKLATKNTVTTVVGSIFPGPPKKMTGGGLEALQVSYAGGLTRGNTGLGFSSLTYDGKVWVIVGVDEGIVPQSKIPASKITDYMVEELQILKKCAEMRNFAAQHV